MGDEQMAIVQELQDQCDDDQVIFEYFISSTQ